MVGGSAQPPSGAEPPVPDIRLFFEAASLDEKRSKAALEALAVSWRDGYAPMIVDLARFMRAREPLAGGGAVEAEPPASDGDERSGPGAARRAGSDLPAARPVHPTTPVRERLLRFLGERTGQKLGDDLRAWRRFLWSRPYEPHPDYVAFKGALYGQVDRRMAAFFAPGTRSLIRLDEIDWGGVGVNGIPPLDHPRHVPAREAAYLKDGHVVFGLFLNGEARAYPRRILAWHEMARDRLGGTELAIVYCTLCGTVIPYGAEVGGRRYTLGTSGLLYRSNKLMFDEETMSLWSTVEGRPVLGPLVDRGIELPFHPVVTTTWSEWRQAHPSTTVLSLDTGFDRDYSEGAAYREYFSHDRLMFEVPKADRRLKDKAEVLTLLLAPPGGEGRLPLAFSAEFLRKNPVHSLRFAGRDLVVVTSPEGANRVYESGPVRFRRRLPDGRLEDAEGGRWGVTEEALVREGGGERRTRVPARRAFWFGWHAQFPETELIR
jgi:hypothetical protein